MIELKCPHCGHQLRVRSKYAGKQGQCKHCKGFVDVPNTYAAEAKEESRRAVADAPTTPINRPESVGGTALADLVGQDVPTTPPPPEIVSPPGDGDGTALADLLAGDDEPGGVKATVPMAPDALDELTAAEPPVAIPHKRLGAGYWLLAIFVAPAALVWGVRLPSDHPQKRTAIAAPILFLGAALVLSVVIFVGNPAALVSLSGRTGRVEYAGPLAIDPPSISMQASPDESVSLRAYDDNGTVLDVVWSSSDPSIASVDGAQVYGVAPGTATITAENAATGQQALATVVVSPASGVAASAGTSYAETRLPSYPGLTFRTADHSLNALAGPLALADRSALTTFVGYTSKDHVTVTGFFYDELQNRGWTIDEYGDGIATNGETHIFGQNGGNGIVYRTRELASRTQVVITYGPVK